MHLFVVHVLKFPKFPSCLVIPVNTHTQNRVLSRGCTP